MQIFKFPIDYVFAYPGPKGFPILGNLIDLVMASDNITKTLGVLGEKYGEIFSVKMGFKRTGNLVGDEYLKI